ncbi:MAG: M42 family metallopeptidase [Bacteroidetes Order II. Incertae sedis bacterium]|nr:M42 family metallopeptidase [Bacteroidetes Order II. bacterium]
MLMHAKEFLWELLQTASPSGFEAPGQRVWAKYTRTFADQVENDAYGNTWAIIKGTSSQPTVMLEAHADEIGFMIHHITSDGLLYVRRVGGTDHAIARGKRVVFAGDLGEVVGVVGNTAIHIRDREGEKVPKIHDLWVDIGADTKDEAEARGLRIGQVGVYVDGPLELTPNRIIGRALDNRIGGYIIAEATRRLQLDKKPTATVYALNAVQEEIGGNGAKMAAYRLYPTVALIVDVCHATDTPGINSLEHGEVKLGAGPTLSHGGANHPLVVGRLMEVAQAEGISLQHEAISRYTGTDTDDIFVAQSGIPSALISLPMRYMHSTIEMIDTRDVENIIRLMVGFVQSVKPEDRFVIKI